MSSTSEKANRIARFFNSEKNPEVLIASIKNKSLILSSDERFPIETRASLEGTNERIAFLKEHGKNFQYLTGEQKFTDIESVQGNIENYIGMTMVPTGIIGPLNVIGSDANGDFYVPLDTSEGALVASYNRGAHASRLARGHYIGLFK